MATNVITAAFAEGCTATKTAALWQWDYGQVLQITGLDLPQSFEAHFTNTPGGGTAKTQIGLNGQVSIPDRYFESGQPIYCYIYLHTGAADGETEYAITIPVKPRAVPLGEAVTHEEQGVIQQYMAALQAGVTAAETSADESAASATESANSATASAESATEAAESATEAAGSATQAAGAATDAEAQVQAAAAQAEAAASAAMVSASYAAQAAQRATEAAQAAQSADASATDAETAKTGAESAQTAASASAAQAAQSVTDAAGQVTLASAQAQAAAQSAQTATAQAQAAETAKTAAQAAQTGAEQAKADTEALLSTKGDALSYDAETGALDLKSGETVLSSVTIEAGGDLVFSGDAKMASAVRNGMLLSGIADGMRETTRGKNLVITYPLLISTAAAGAGTTRHDFLRSGVINLSKTNGVACTFTPYRVVYLKGKVNGVTFTVDATDMFAQTFDDGYSYMLLGYAISAEAIYLYPHNPVYQRIGNALLPYAPSYTYSLAYDQTTGRLSLLKDGTEISHVILSGLPVTITRDGDTLRVNNVPAVTSITQTDGTLALT